MEGPELLQTFESELRKSAEQIQSCLLALEAGDGGESLQEAYRLTHSVKGASRVVGLMTVEELAHALEDRLQSLVREGQIPGTAEVGMALRIVDGFVASMDAFLKGADYDPAPLIEEFRQAVAAPAVAAPVPASAPAPAPAAVPAPAGPAERPQPPARPRGGEPAAPDTNVAPPPPRKDDFLRIPTQGVDELFRRVEEAFLIETRLSTLVGTLDESNREGLTDADRDRTAAALRRETTRLHQVLLQFHELVRAFRMEPIDRLRVPLQRAVRDLAASLDKQASFRLLNGRQLVDTALLDSLMDPLLHVVRNAVDHGIEPAAEREAAGKPAEGTVELKGAMRGGTLEIVVRDDGRGASVEAIRKKALEGGFVTAEQASNFTEAQWLALPFRPGFSTASTVSAISGRGMGLDIVRDRVRGLGGDVHLSSRTGRGTSIEIRVPVRLLTARTLLLRCGGHLAGLPVADVERVLRYRAQETESVGGQTHVRWEQMPIPVDLLAGYLGWRAGAPETGHLVIVSRLGARRGLLVDEVLGEIEQPALPAPWNLRGMGYLGGLIVMGDGALVPLLEVRELVRWAGGTAAVEAVAPMVVPTRESERRIVMVVDDSATIRALHRSILQSVGYEVLTAEDGAEALALLHRRAVDLVITDVQMPRMDGLTLIRRIREVPAWQRLPLVVVSQYGRRDDLQKAASAGADRYIVKSSFKPKQLTDMVAELLD